MANKKIKVAIVHDSYLHLGGAERVLHTLLEIYPQADVFIPLIDKVFEKKIAKNHKLKTSVLNLLPFKKDIASLLKPLVLIFWKNLDLSDYDLVISSSHSFSSKSVSIEGNAPHVSYIHTPPRYLYEEFNEMGWIKKQPWKFLLSPIFNHLRKLDFKDAQKPDLLIANSKTVQKRIKKYYQRDSVVIYPPIKIKKHVVGVGKNKKKYFVFHSRLVKQKGAELAIKTFNEIGDKLIIIGTGKEEEELKKIAKSNISFLGFVSDEKISKIYQNVKSLIYTSIEEDFGLTPLEAMSYGVPVIGYKSGGVNETVINNKTGVLFNDYTVASLKKAINKFEKIQNSNGKISTIVCKKQASKFSIKIFKKKIKKLINHNLPSKVK